MPRPGLPALATEAMLTSGSCQVAPFRTQWHRGKRTLLTIRSAAPSLSTRRQSARWQRSLIYPAAKLRASSGALEAAMQSRPRRLGHRLLPACLAVRIISRHVPRPSRLWFPAFNAGKRLPLCRRRVLTQSHLLSEARRIAGQNIISKRYAGAAVRLTGVASANRCPSRGDKATYRIWTDKSKFPATRRPELRDRSRVCWLPKGVAGATVLSSRTIDPVTISCGQSFARWAASTYAGSSIHS